MGPLQAVEQLKYLHSHRGVEHRHRLIGHQELRPQDHGPGDDHPLLLPAAEHVGKLRQKILHRR
jgi:hypothetical protein